MPTPYSRPLATALLALLPGLAPGLAQAQVPSVVTDMPVTQSLVAMVMGELGSPEVLLAQGADPHHAQLRPSQARALNSADLVVWIGEDLTPWLEGPVESLAEGRVLSLASIDGLHLRPYGGEEALEADAHDDHGHEEHEHGHDEHGHDDNDHGHDDHAHDDHDGHGHEEHAHDDDDHAGHGDHHEDEHDHDHGHAHSGTDPHLWLDPQNAMTMLRSIAAQLSAQDPENATTYAAQAETAINALQSLQGELAAILAPAQDAGLVMFHDAYGYFAGAFGLQVVGTIADSEATTPGAASLSTLRASLDERGAVCLFPEANHPDDLAQVVAEGTDLRIGEPLDPAGMMLETGAGQYPALMRSLAQSIADCVAG